MQGLRSDQPSFYVGNGGKPSTDWSIFMVRKILTLLIATVAAPAWAAPDATGSVVVTDSSRMTWWGKWTCMITNQGGHKAVETNKLVAERGKEQISFIASHNYSTGYKWGIRTYNFCQYGAGRGVKSTPSLAIRVGDAAGLEQSFSYKVDKGWRGDFNVLAEAFLTSAPRDNSSGNLEVGFHLRNNWALSRWLKKKGVARARGKFTDRFGQKWIVSDAPGPAGVHGYIIIQPNTPTMSRTTGILPWGEALAYLVRTGIAKQDWYLQGVFFGPEVTSGKATVRVQLGGLVRHDA